MQNNYLGLLGIARRGGMVEIGDESVRAALLTKKGRLVLVASDASERSKNTFFGIAETASVFCIEVAETMAELGNALGKRPCAAVCVCDMGIAAALVKKLSEINPEAGALLPQIDAKAKKIAARKNKKKQK